MNGKKITSQLGRVDAECRKCSNMKIQNAISILLNTININSIQKLKTHSTFHGATTNSSVSKKLQSPAIVTLTLYDVWFQSNNSRKRCWQCVWRLKKWVLCHNEMVLIEWELIDDEWMKKVTKNCCVHYSSTSNFTVLRVCTLRTRTYSRINQSSSDETMMQQTTTTKTTQWIIMETYQYFKSNHCSSLLIM